MFNHVTMTLIVHEYFKSWFRFKPQDIHRRWYLSPASYNIVIIIFFPFNSLDDTFVVGLSELCAPFS